MRARSSQALKVVAIAPPAPRRDLSGIVRVLTCGSVDDGKSTLIGRLLWDASDLFDDQREALRRSDKRVLNGEHLDYSLLVDGLIAEREQGITIDIAWRTFDTADRRFVIIDSPGHEQYTRNMASGASQADVAVMLIDARAGIKRQTRRHAAILDLFGVRHVVLAVNKMDLADWSEAKFRSIEKDFEALKKRFGFVDTAVIPVSAVTGDNIARQSERMRWYRGPSLLGYLSQIPEKAAPKAGAFRMPVQTVLRDGQDFRGLAGTISSGVITVGDRIVDAVGKTEARVKRIATMDGDLPSARRGQAIALVLDSDIDVSRGAVLSAPNAAATAARRIEGSLVWVSEQPFDPGARYLLRTATDLVPVSHLGIRSLLDLETLERTSAPSCAMNDIAVVAIDLVRPTSLDVFTPTQETGAFLLVDAISGATVAGGVVAALHATSLTDARATGATIFTLTRALLNQGLCADLAGKSDADAELRRRGDEVVTLLKSAGVTARLDID